MELQPAVTFHPNFTAVKKSQFNGIDYAVVEKFKPPIEKFNSCEDLQTWAEEKCRDIIHSDLGGRNKEIYFQRREELLNWGKNLNYENKTNSEKLFVLSGITKHLNQNDDTYVPVYDEIVLKKSLEEIKLLTKDKKNPHLSFNEIYRKNLIDSVILNENSNLENIWVHIPSKKENRNDYKDNIKKLQIISSQHWCTKSEHAKDFLRDCDFDIYLENRSPKLAIKSEEGYIIEIEDELNSRKVPSDYKKIIKNYIKERDMVLSESAQKILDSE